MVEGTIADAQNPPPSRKEVASCFGRVLRMKVTPEQRTSGRSIIVLAGALLMIARLHQENRPHRPWIGRQLPSVT
jgi:hypothetical protein